jgi:hypothetical protein
MEAPPPLLAWLGVLGGVLSVILAVLEINKRWIDRHRLNLRVLSAHQKTDKWFSWDVERFSGTNPYGSVPGAPSVPAPFREGDIKRVFTVLELAIENQYPKDVIISNIVVNGTIYADKHFPTMRSYRDDYRAYDLQTQEPISLDQVRIIPAGGTFGIHLEILNEAFEEWRTKAVYALEERKTHVVKYHTSVGTPIQRIKPTPVSYEVRRWSDLIGPVPTHFPPPGGWPTYKTPWRTRARWWITRTITWLLYGTEYKSQDQPNRLRKFLDDRRRS